MKVPKELLQMFFCYFLLKTSHYLSKLMQNIESRLVRSGELELPRPCPAHPIVFPRVVQHLGPGVNILPKNSEK